MTHNRNTHQSKHDYKHKHVTNLNKSDLRGTEEEEGRERKASSARANLRRVRLHETVMLVEQGKLLIASMTHLHLYFANSTCATLYSSSILLLLCFASKESTLFFNCKPITSNFPFLIQFWRFFVIR